MKGSIRKTGKQSWEIRVDVGKDPSTGKRRQKSISIRGTKKEAERKLAEIICQLESGSFVEPAKMTFGEYMERWLRDYVGMTVRETTRESYETLVRTHIVPALGHIPLSKLSPVHLQEFYARALENGRKDGRGGLSTRTVRYIHGLIHEALDRALKQGIVARNVADAAEPPRESKREIRPLKEEEVARLLAEIRDMRLLVPVTLAVLGGMRRGEVLGLRWEDVNLSTGEVYVRQSLDRITKKGLVVGEPKTARSRRRITLPPSAVEVLKKW
ncbi:MAG TPA: site-specific integrase, partial [Clostridia bacterium]|nr:site-specific integrase [Clostridia bacterium]